jgi:hydroxymethylpyrimidine pyrophosphatase-like HAD family hydrolase
VSRLQAEFKFQGGTPERSGLLGPEDAFLQAIISSCAIAHLPHDIITAHKKCPPAPPLTAPQRATANKQQTTNNTPHPSDIGRWTFDIGRLPSIRYYALATDYDGTLARHGQVDASTLNALERLKGTGRRLIMVTGRELDDLLRVFPEVSIFDRVVAENGALVYSPGTHQETLLGERPPQAYIDRLRERGAAGVSVGRIIVATWTPYETLALELIREMGLEHQVIFNKGAVMILPPGVNKATGLAAALKDLGLSPHNVVSVGDAENDHALLKLCECGVAVENAIPHSRRKRILSPPRPMAKASPN